MNTGNVSRRIPLARGRSAVAPGQLWAIVLAGGEGVRLRALTRRVCGDDRPKQYAALSGARSLLRQSLDRVALAIPDQRVTVVTHQKHERYLAAEFATRHRPHVLAQPDDRGTAAGVLFPAHWISWQDPGATVAVFPSDHFILEEAAFMTHVQGVAAFVGQHPEWVVLLGALPYLPRPRRSTAGSSPPSRSARRLAPPSTECAIPGRSPRRRLRAHAWRAGTSGTPLC